MDRVLLAEPRGFCAGVEKAIKALAWMVRVFEPPVYCYHEIVHNRHVVDQFRAQGVVFVDDVDLATLAAIRYARGLRPTTLRAVHFIIDSARAQQVHEKWIRFGQDIPLEMIDAPDRRLTRASLELVSREAAQKSTQVTVVLPRRGYAPLLGRILHDRTADKIAEVVSQVPNAAATIIPFDVESRVHLLHARQAARLAAQDGNGAMTAIAKLTGLRPMTSTPARHPISSPRSAT